MTMRPRDFALALLIVVIWGLNFAVIKFGVVGVPPLLLGCLRFVAAALPVLFVPRPRLPLRLYIACGMTISVAQFSFLFYAISVGMPSGLASLVLQSQAFFTMILAVLWLKEHWHAHQLGGLLLAGVGLVLIGMTHGQEMPLLGFLLTIAAATMWATGNIVTRAVAKYGPVDPFGFVVWASLVPPIPFFLLSLWLEGWPAISTALVNLSWGSLAAIGYLAWAATLLGYGLWTRLLTRYPANQVAPFTLLVPLVGVTTGWLLFDERLGALHFAGAALLMCGLLLNLFGGSILQRLRR